MRQELRQLGLDVRFDFIPVSPSLEGTLVASGGSDGREEFVHPCGVTGHTPAVRLPLDLFGAFELTIGRPAEPEEDYVSSPALGTEAPGAALHGSRIFNLPLPQALAMLEERNLTAE